MCTYPTAPNACQAMASANPLMPALALLLIARRREQLARRREIIVAAGAYWYEHRDQFGYSEGSEEEYIEEEEEDFEDSEPFDIQVGPHMHDDTLPPEQRNRQHQQGSKEVEKVEEPEPSTLQAGPGPHMHRNTLPFEKRKSEHMTESKAKRRR
jgi:hypothetical protein